MKNLVIDHKNGNTTKYNLYPEEGNLPIAYESDTPEQLVKELEICRKNRVRIKVNYGDPETGKSWNEEHQTIGYIGLSRGREARFPILVFNERSMGGGSLITGKILKLEATNSGYVLYKADNFIPTVIEIKENKEAVESPKYEVYLDGKLYASCKNQRDAKLLKKRLS